MQHLFHLNLNNWI